MLRTVSLLAFVVGCCCLTAFRGTPDVFKDDVIFNSKVAHVFKASTRSAPGGFMPYDALEADTTSQARVLMLNYSSFDADYANMVHRTLQRQMPMCSITDFWEGTADDLAAQLAGQDAVVISYPADGDSAIVRAYAKVLNQFIRQGGGVVITGTHEFSVLQQFGLFDIDSGYYCDGLEIHTGATGSQHPVLSGIGDNFTLHNFAYPLDVSDPAFVTLADIRGYPVLGYKPIGSGKVVYLGLEYFYDEPKTARILYNAVNWLVPPKSSSVNTGNSQNDRNLKRTEEFLYAGSGGRTDLFDLKIYPNPYFNKATLDIELTRSVPVGADITDEMGRMTAVLLPKKQLTAGLYRFELPNLAAGVYFVRCQIGDKTVVRKVVKTNAN